MEKKIMLLILSGLLLASFFVPNIEWQGFTMSGFDFVVSEHTPQIKYSLLAVPGCAIFLMASSMVDENRIMDNRFLLRIPLLVLIGLAAFFYLNTEARKATGSLNPFTIFCIGAWIALAVSLVLAFKKRELIH